jgi:pyruvate/2-oxoglutarate dehydrogenase complex dihydrolipoamide acyltransferase (E2) component
VEVSYLILPELGVEDRPITACLWLVKRGEKVSQGESLLEVLSDAANVELPSPVDGVLIKKLVTEGEPLSVGQRLAAIERVC